MPHPARTIAPGEPQGSSSACSSAGSGHPNAVDACVRSLARAAQGASSVLLVCEHSLEGVLCGIGVAYLAHMDKDRVRLCANGHVQPALGESVVAGPQARSDEAIALARRVYGGLRRCVSEGCTRLRGGSCPTSCGAACVSKLLYAAAADSESMPETLHRYARLAFEQGPRVRNMTSHECVMALDELARYTLNECEKTRQFVRFRKLADDSFLAVFRPQANTLPLVARHFAQRMRQDRFCMVDPQHRVAVFHREGRPSCATVLLDEQMTHALASREDLSEDERYVQALWKTFYRVLELPGRDASQRGYDLRVKWMPKRFWAGLPELQP